MRHSDSVLISHIWCSRSAVGTPYLTIWLMDIGWKNLKVQFKNYQHHQNIHLYFHNWDTNTKTQKINFMSMFSIMMEKSSFMKKFSITDTKYSLTSSIFTNSHQISMSFSIKLVGNNLLIGTKIWNMIFSTTLKLRKITKTQGEIFSKASWCGSWLFRYKIINLNLLIIKIICHRFVSHLKNQQTTRYPFISKNSNPLIIKSTITLSSKLSRSQVRIWNPWICSDLLSIFHNLIKPQII